jgi:uncharacterized protein
MAGVRERLVFDSEAGTVRDGPRRYLLMRPDVLMGLFARLDPQARAVALQAFTTAAGQHGGDSLAAYFANVGEDAEALLDATAAAAADLGWGRWSFARDGDRLRLVVTDSPFAHGFAAATGGTATGGTATEGAATGGTAQEPVCAPICGLLSAAAGLVLGGGASGDAARGAIDARELTCAAAGAGRCEFVASRHSPPASVPPRVAEAVPPTRPIEG